MTLEEALSAKKLMKLTPYRGYSPCGTLTGRYFYETATDEEKETDIKVEVKNGWFSTEWVYLIHLKEVKDAR